MEARCQCGSVTFKTPLEKPLALYICHCFECRRQTSSAFGTSAIFPKFDLPSADLLSCYTRPTPSGHTLYCYFCKQCGTRLIHTTPNKNVVSVKGGCLSGLDWKTAIHIWTRSAMVPIPEGSETHSEESEYTAYGDSQETLDQPIDLRGSGGTPSVQDFGTPIGSDANIGRGPSDPIRGACELSDHEH
ncbi:glutathione-dependent formaldehyde-activating enzyme [Lasiosphaeris hirsuta]|uniref:Glutathione-dependent formaldehyde-activating enzyme n=1 Tax=Lasiosphaeris hirsuta TaxID=260670 RepID=A0AA40BBQ3_9PEZI|nr:glutathione-dependent formaldehyde-activating enzyme [Lasiosphaeris hirsuta]